MRQFAWYSPEIDVIVLQTIADDCAIIFEWDYFDLCKCMGPDEPMGIHLWIPLGEL